MKNLNKLISYIKTHGLLTGSRAFFKNPCPNADWDYVVQDTKEFEQLMRLSRSERMQVSLPGSDSGSIKFKYVGQIYDIIVVNSASARSFETWKAATEEMKKLCEVSSVFRKLLQKHKDLRIYIFQALSRERK